MRRATVAGVLTLLFVTLFPLAGQAAPRVTHRADRDGNKIFDRLDQAMRGKSAEHRFDVIVLFSGGKSIEQAAAARRAVGDFDVAYHYRTMPAVGATMTVGQIKALAARSDTVQIQRNEAAGVWLDSARAASGSDEAQVDFAVDGNNESGACPGVRDYCADDVVVAVLDTGIANGHVDLDAGKVIKHTNCAVGADDPCNPFSFDNSGHGTAVASVVAGEGDGNPAYHGVAPGAALVNVQVASGSLSTQMWMDKGIEWVLQNKDLYGIEALNMSIGTFSSSDGTDSTSRLINKAAAAGVVPFVSAGNSGAQGPQTIGSPAAAKFAVTVGAMADPGNSHVYQPLGWGLWQSSARGPTVDGRIKPDVVAPGVSITAAGGGGTDTYSEHTGTSLSSPFAAGVGALVIDANPSLGSSGLACPAGDLSADCLDGVFDSTMVTGVKDTLTGTAQDWGPAGQDNHYGFGRLDAYAAVDAASPVVGDGGPSGPAHLFAAGSLAGTGAVADHAMTVTGTQWPLSATIITPTAVRTSGGDGYIISPDFTVSILDPSGATVATAPIGNSWTENAAVVPAVTGGYTVRVRSLEGGGPYWLDISVAGAETPPPSPPSPPSAPTGLTAAAVSGSLTQIDLSWGNVAAESGYKVERSPDGVSSWAQIATTGTDATSYRDSGLTSGTTYYYRVIAYNAGGNSAPSNVASATTNRDTVAPTTPTGVKATGGKAKVTLTWRASTDSGSGLAGYKVFRATASSGPFTQVTTTTSLSYVDTAVTRGKTYWYYLVAYDNAGNNSAASAKVSAKPS